MTTTYDWLQTSRSILLVFLVVVPVYAQYPPPVGFIDFYGLRTLQESTVRAALQITVGQTIEPDALWRVEARLRELPGVQAARVTLVCCEEGKSVVYVGISEAVGSTVKLRAVPRRTTRLPREVTDAGAALRVAIDHAVLSGDAGDDQSQGHSLANNAAVRAVQERFVTLARRHRSHLRAVLFHSKLADQRALAAEVLAYAPDKKSVAADLAVAVLDPAAEVRNNAMRALAALASSPHTSGWIPTRPLVDMLSSVEWSDRNKAAAVLFALTTSRRDPAILMTLRHVAALSLAEMARWNSPGHAQSAFFLLGRIGGLPDASIAEYWAVRDLRPVLVAAENADFGNAADGESM